MRYALHNNDDFLPDIIEVAQQLGVTVGEPLNHRPNEHRVDCPFCDDSKKHMYLNSEKKVFNCYRCTERGGVIKFISLLTNRNENDVLQDYVKRGKLKFKAGPPKPPKIKHKNWWDKYLGLEEAQEEFLSKGSNFKHPATKLNGQELKKLGVSKKPNWYYFAGYNYQGAKNYADGIVEKIQEIQRRHEEYLKYRALKELLISLEKKQYQKGIKWVNELSNASGIDLLTPCLEWYDQDEIPKWVYFARLEADNWKLNKEIQLIINKHKNNKKRPLEGVKEAI